MNCIEPGPLCKMCDLGVEMEMSADIDHLNVQTTAVLYRFEFETEWLTIKRLDMRAFAALSAEMLASLTLDVSYNLDETYPIMAPKNLMKLQFTIAGIPIVLDMFVSIDMHYIVNFEGVATATMPLVYDLPGIVAILQYGSDFPETVKQVSMYPSTSSGGDVDIQAHAQLDAALGLVPTVTFSLNSLLSLDITVEIYANASASFQFPPLPGIETDGGVYLPQYNYHYPALCTRNHYVEYVIDAGLTEVTLTASLVIDINLLMHIYYFKSYTTTVSDPVNFPVLAGCLFSTDLPSTKFTLVIGTQALVSEIEGLMTAIAKNLATATGVNMYSLVMENPALLGSSVKTNSNFSGLGESASTAMVMNVIAGSADPEDVISTRIFELVMTWPLPPALASEPAARYIDPTATAIAVCGNAFVPACYKLDGCAGGHCAVMCDVGCTGTNSTIHCLMAGAWSSPPAGTCTAITCPAAPTVTNGALVAACGTSYDTVCTYSCDSDFTMSGPATITCGGTGTWSTAPMCLSVCKTACFSFYV